MKSQIMIVFEPQAKTEAESPISEHTYDQQKIVEDQQAGQQLNWHQAVLMLVLNPSKH